MKMKKAFKGFVLNYNNQKEAERKSIARPTMQHETLEMKPFRKPKPQDNTRHLEQNSSSQPAARLMSTQFEKIKTSTPMSLVIGSSRNSATHESLISSAGYNNFQNSLLFKANKNW